MSSLHDTLEQLAAMAGVDVAKMAPRAKAPAKPRAVKAKAAPKPKLGGQGRKGPGARGKTGTRLPKSAPVHAGPARDTPAWHANNRAALANRSSKVRTGHAAKMPQERHGAFKCGNCGFGSWREHHLMTNEGKHHATLALKGCTRCGTMHPTRVGVGKDHVDTPDVVKVMDTSETAALRKDDGGRITDLVGHRTNCPKGGSSQCGAEQDGRCGLCGADVQDHEAVGPA